MYTYGHTLSLHDALPICFETVEARIGASAGKILDVDIQRGIVAITGLALAAACGLDFGLGSTDARRARIGFLHSLRQRPPGGERPRPDGPTDRKSVG